MRNHLKLYSRWIFSRFTGLERAQKRIISVISDLVFILFSLWAAFSLRFETLFFTQDPTYYALFGLTALATVFLFARLGLYRAVIRYISERALVTVLVGIAVSTLTFIAIAFLLQIDIPRSVPVLYGALAFLFVTGTRFSIRNLLNRPRHLSKMPVLIVGSGETGLQLASALSQGIEYRPMAFISLEPDNHKTTINGMPVYDLNHAKRAVHKHQTERIFLAVDPNAEIDRQALLGEAGGTAGTRSDSALGE